jgi:hypothetical protein
MTVRRARRHAQARPARPLSSSAFDRVRMKVTAVEPRSRSRSSPALGVARRHLWQCHRLNAERFAYLSPSSIVVSGKTWYAVNFNHRQEWVPSSEVSATRTT